MKITNRVNIHLDDRHLIPPVDVMQGDTDTRVLEMELYAGNEAWNVPDGAAVSVAYCRSDGSKGIYDTLPNGTDACSVAGNVVTSVLVPHALAVSGNTVMTVLFTDDTGKQLATFCVLLRVERNPAVGAANPEDYYNIRQWVTEGPMYVAIHTGDDGEYTADRTFEEIHTAYAAGRAVNCYLDSGVILPLVSGTSDEVAFQCVVDREYVRVVITAEEAVSYSMGRYVCMDEQGVSYYASLSNAINDINNGVITNALASMSAARVKVFTAHTGVRTVMLLADVDENETITVNKSLDIALNGHVLNFTASAACLYLAENINCTIWGTQEGSAITKEDITSTDRTYLIQAYATKFKINGGLYKTCGSVANAECGVYVMETCTDAEINNCSIIAENTDSTSTANVIALGNKGANTIIKNAEIMVSGNRHMTVGLFNTSVVEMTGTNVTANAVSETAENSV